MTEYADDPEIRDLLKQAQGREESVHKAAWGELQRYRTEALAGVKTGEDTIERLVGCFSVREEVITLQRAATVALLVARPWRSMRKYGPRGLRYALLEAGAIAQNIHLATQALGFASVDCASVVDDEVHETLGLDGLYQTLVHAIILGYAG